MGKSSSFVQFLRVPAAEDSTVNAWINDDIRPLPPSRRKWTNWTYISWWSVWMMALSNFQIGSSLVATGLSIWQAMIAVILGRIIIAGVAVLTGYPGAHWHIGFPIVSRMVWGMYGSYFVICLRILLGLVGFAVQSWLGGLCVTAVLSGIFPSFYHMPNTLHSSNLTTSQLVGWIVFLVVSVPIIYIRPEHSRRVMAVMNGITFVTLVSILIWSLNEAKGAGPLLSQPGMLHSSSGLGWAIVGGVNNVIGTVAPALMSQSDFSRFARRPREQVFGQWFAFVVVGTIMPLFGCLVSSATQAIYGQAIWNPPILVLTWLATGYHAKSRAAAVFAGLGLAISQMATVVVDNAYSVGIDLSGIFPIFINVRRGAYIGLALSMVLCPWELLSTAAIFLTVISSFTVFFGPICGIEVCDYFLIRRRRIKLTDLYLPKSQSIYYYFKGLNWRSFTAWVVGWAPLFPGLLHAIKPSIEVTSGAANLYNVAFVLGFAISFLVYFVLNKAFPPPGLGWQDDFDEFGTFTPDEAQALGVAIRENSSSSSDTNERYSEETKA